tara:strand:+ start:1662 stop:1985 length:324 start_codon:yes stop_codon:yes gene_type:complete
MAFTSYHNISGSTAVTNRLIQRGSNANNIKSILITNTHGTNNGTITLFLQDSTGVVVKSFNILSTVLLPPDTSLLLDNQALLSFDNNIYDLFITVGSSDTVDVLINK